MIFAEQLTNNNVAALLEIQLRNDFLLEQFLIEEFSYKGAEKLVQPFSELPFRDIHADSFFKAGILPLADLKQYVQGRNISRLLGELDLKPWVALGFIKDELAKCGVQYHLISMSQQQFIYDKEVYGTMNIAKFACRQAFDDFIVYGVGMERFRFRFKDILLNKVRQFWASASRSITIRDMQKLMNYFSARFAESMSDYCDKGLKKLNALTKEIEEEEEELGYTEAPEEEIPTTTEEITTTAEIPKSRKHKKSRKFKTTTTPEIPTESTTEISTYYTTEDLIETYITEIPLVESTDEPIIEKESEDDGPESSFKVLTNEPHVRVVNGCVIMDFAKNDTETCNNLLSLPDYVKNKLYELFPESDMKELPYMTKDHTFKLASIPITIRVMLTHPAKIPEVLDIFHKDLSTESRDIIENCQEELCDEPDEVVEISDNESEINQHHRQKLNVKKFFQDRALRYNVSKNNSLLAYATSSPRLSIDTQRKKFHKFKKPPTSGEFNHEVRALWENLLQSQVAENFAIHHRSALQ